PGPASRRGRPALGCDDVVREDRHAQSMPDSTSAGVAPATELGYCGAQESLRLLYCTLPSGIASEGGMEDQTQAQIRQFIIANFLFGDTSRVPGDAESLLGSGVV